MPRTRWTVVAFALTVAAIGTACAQDDGDGGLGATAGGDSGGRTAAAEMRAADRAFEQTGGGGDSTASLPRIGPAVIKTGDLSVKVKNGALDDSVTDVGAVAGRYGGYVVSSEVDDDAGGTGTVSIRVPSEDFDNALDALKDIGVDVDRQQVSTEDVSQEYIDLEARLRNWSAQEAVLLRLMDRANSIASSIRVQSELQRVQLEIERIRGQLDYLDDQTTLSTITVSLFEAGATPGDDSMIAEAWQQAVRVMLAFVSALIVGTGVIVPLAVLALVGALLFRALRPRFSS